MDRLFTEALSLERPDWLVARARLWDGPLPDRSRAWRSRSGATRGWWSAGARSPATWPVGSAGPTPSPTAEDRYPSVDLAEIDGDGVDLVLLPDEPYVFTADDGPAAFARVPTRLVSGRLLTWYGPSLLEARALLDRT